MREFLIALATVQQSAKSPLNLRYYSQSAYKLGPLNVKFSLRPVSGAPAPPPDKADAGFLRTAMKGQLEAGEFEYELLMQRQLDDPRMPIEDPTQVWSEAASTPVPVATLRVLQQSFDQPEREQISRQIAFNPWHALEAHRPLGGINRTRRAVYEAIAHYRSDAGSPLFQPEDWNSKP